MRASLLISLLGSPTASIAIASAAAVVLAGQPGTASFLAMLGAAAGLHAIGATGRRRAAPAADSTGNAITTREISIVCADIRNYTAFCAGLAPQDVLRFLHEYYTAAGDVVQAHGATIKDYAGDGILILVGATRDQPDHADRALRLAKDLRTATLAVTRRWSRRDGEIGVGVGVASGRVALGMLGGTMRREFAAVGDAVNLSARLCASAAPGQILIDQRTRQLARFAGRDAMAPRNLALKGFGPDVTGYVA